jgi:hypothetical protein
MVASARVLAVMVRRRFVLLAWAAIGLVEACAPARVAVAAPQHDQAVPAGEPRALLRLELDLPKTATCEEDFDLALYADRGIDRVEWEGLGDKCSSRRATIRYLSNRIDSQKLVERIRKLAVNVRVLGHE